MKDEEEKTREVGDQGDAEKEHVIIPFFLRVAESPWSPHLFPHPSLLFGSSMVKVEPRPASD